MRRAWLLLATGIVAGSSLAHADCVPDRAGARGYQPAPVEAGRRVLEVGPGRTLATPGAAARVARDGDVVLIDSAEYLDTRAVWPQSGLLIRGVAGRPQLRAGETLAQGKAIWVVNGDDVTIENLEFSGAHTASNNGAGIRAQGRRLTVRAGQFHDNDMGILSGNDPEQEVIVEYSEFTRNGHESGKAHNIYIGAIRRFELSFSSSQGARIGHLVKSRARENLIAYNRLADVPAGPSSYELDFPRSTAATVIGNIILQSEASPNGAVLSYGAEDRGRPPLGRLRVASNTFVSLRPRPVFIFNHSVQPALVVGNVFGGATGESVRGAAEQDGNLLAAMDAFVAPASLDFGLREAALPVRDAGAAAAVRPPDLVPKFEYVHPHTGRMRDDGEHALPGALAYCGGPGA